jgi:hypothetical protein
MPTYGNTGTLWSRNTIPETYNVFQGCTSIVTPARFAYRYIPYQWGGLGYIAVDQYYQLADGTDISDATFKDMNGGTTYNVSKDDAVTIDGYTCVGYTYAGHGITSPTGVLTADGSFTVIPKALGDSPYSVTYIYAEADSTTTVDDEDKDKDKTDDDIIKDNGGKVITKNDTPQVEDKPKATYPKTTTPKVAATVADTNVLDVPDNDLQGNEISVEDNDGEVIGGQNMPLADTAEGDLTANSASDENGGSLLWLILSAIAAIAVLLIIFAALKRRKRSEENNTI